MGRLFMDNIFIFGHKKPDTDSVCGAISLSYLKNQLGFHTEPRVLGNINNETKYALNYFHVDIPKYLNDVKLQVKDIHYSKDYVIKSDTSIYDSYLFMGEHAISTLPIVDEEKKYIGTLSMKDIAHKLVNSEEELVFTSYKNIISSINGESLLKFEEEIQGELLIAAYRSTTFIENIKISNRTVLIVGDRHSIIEYAIKNHAKMIILTGNAEIHKEHLDLAKENKVNIIKTSLNSLSVSKKIALANYVSTIANNRNITCVDENMQVSDFIELANRTKFSNYPVLGKNLECTGILRLADISDREKKQVILVDHNELSQSVDGLDEAEILEIIDHHKLGTIGTSVPINFRNMPVGSSNTIIYRLFQENHVEIPDTIAGLIVSGILSDTLLFKSPTTTDLDREAVITLSKQINLDYEKYASLMFEAGFSIEGREIDDVFYTDFKDFIIDQKKIGVSQVSTMNIQEFHDKIGDFENLIEEIAQNNDYHILAMFVTDVKRNGSHIYFNNKAHDILCDCFDLKDLTQGQFFDGVVSRKKQIIPRIVETLEK